MEKKFGTRTPINKLINASYDLDICKNIFNGRELIVRSWKKLLYRYDYIKMGFSFMVNFYESSPCYCNKEICTCDMWDYHINKDRTLDRMNKYRQRGFNVKEHPNNKQIIEYIKKSLEPDGVHKTFGYNSIEFIENGSLNLDTFYIE